MVFTVFVTSVQTLAMFVWPLRIPASAGQVPLRLQTWEKMDDRPF
jgi:hypothetical protein